MTALRTAVAVARSAARGVSRDRVPMMGAALAYYTVFSIAPLLVLSMAAAGLLLGGVDSRIFASIQSVVGPNGAAAIRSMVDAAASKPHAGMVASILGFVTLIVGASGVFTQLQESLDVIWKAQPRPGAGWLHLARQRLMSFAMIGVIAFLLLASLLVSAALSAAGSVMAGAIPGGARAWSLVDLGVSFAIVSLLFAAIFKVLPDVRLRWRDVAAGGAFTGLLFAVGKQLIGLYIGKSGLASAYGAVGSLVVVLVWVFYSSQILLVGAEFTRAVVTRHGHWPPAKPGARLVR